MESVEGPLVRFGVLTDTQYADCDSKPAWWNPNLTRYYRTALDQIDKAFAHWKREGTVTFALQLGDIIDGVNRKVSNPDLALRTVLARFERHLQIPTFHTVGNHELYNFSRRELAKYFYEYLDRMHLPQQMFDFPSEEKGAAIYPNGSFKSKEFEDLNRMCPDSTVKTLDDTRIFNKKARLECQTAEPQNGLHFHDIKQLPYLNPTHPVNARKAEHRTLGKSAVNVFHNSSKMRLGLLSKDRNISAINKCLPSVGEAPSLYYAFRPVQGVKLISLDCFEVSVIGYNKTDSRYKEAAAVLFEHHGHEDFEGWDCADLLEGCCKRFQQMNGAVSEEQLQWLHRELTESDELKEKVIVFGHVCLHPESADWDCLLWNYDRVLEVFHAHGCVSLYLCGHTHQNGYALDHKGIHYVVMAGIIETAPEEMAFATVDVFRNRINITGHGREESRTLWLGASNLVEIDPQEIPENVDTLCEPQVLMPSVKVVV